MADEINEFKFAKRGRPVKYPWDKWLNGSPWELTQGTDFDGEIKSMRGAVYAAADARHLKAHTSVRNNVLIVQSYQSTEDAPSTESD